MPTLSPRQQDMVTFNSNNAQRDGGVMNVHGTANFFVGDGRAIVCQTVGFVHY